MQRLSIRVLASVLALFIAMPPNLPAQQGQGPVFKSEELEQILAPIALYPDELVSQILMASTYPLEVVQADRFAQQNKNLKGDALTQSLESQSWDPSVQSLVNFPQVLTMMSEKLDWTQKMGDAFLAQQEDVMDTIQKLRFRAQESGNLKTTKEQKVIVQEKVIVIEPATPQVIYVPTYNPTVVYGAWPYPAYPPYYYYPPGYVATSAFWFASGIALGAAWGYAWGGCHWGNKKVTYNYNQNININRNINRNKYVSQYPSGGRGDWKHNPEHRRGVNYRDQRTAQRYNRGANSEAVRSREAFRGRAEQGRQDLARGRADQFKGRPEAGRAGQPGTRDRVGTADRGQQARDRVGGADRGGQPSARDRAGGAGRGGQPSARDRAGGADRSGMQNRGGAFQGVDRGGSAARSASQRGSSSRGGVSGGGRSGGGFSGGRGGGGRR